MIAFLVNMYYNAWNVDSWQKKDRHPQTQWEFTVVTCFFVWVYYCFMHIIVFLSDNHVFEMLSLISLQLCNQPGTLILQPTSLPPPPTPWPLEPLSLDLTAHPSKISLWPFLSLICDPGLTPQRHNRDSFRWWSPPLLIRPTHCVDWCLCQIIPSHSRDMQFPPACTNYNVWMETWLAPFAPHQFIISWIISSHLLNYSLLYHS